MRLTTGLRNETRREIVTAMLLATTAGTTALMPTAAMAQSSSATRSFNIPAQALPDALILFGRQAGIEVTAEAANTRGRSTQGVSGNLAPAEALSRLLSGTGLTFRWQSDRAVVVEPAPKAADGSIQLGPVRVEGDSARTTGLQPSITTDSAATEGTRSYTTGVMATATKLPLAIRETPQSVTVVTRQQMDDQAILTMEDVVLRTNGLSLSKWGTERSQFFSRGFGITNYIVDGLPMLYNSDAISTGTMATYDRVEVVRGATGMMIGAGNPSASMNFVRKRPLKEAGLTMALTGGSWNNIRGEVDASVPITSDGAVRARTVLSYQDRDGFTDGIHYKRALAYGIIEADLGSHTLLTLGATHNDDDNDGVDWNGVGRALDGSALPIPRSMRHSPTWSYWDKTTTQAFAEIEQKIGDSWLIKANFTYMNAKMDMLGSYLGVASSDPLRFSVNTGQYTYHQDHYSVDLYASGSFNLFGRNHELVVGGSYRKKDENNTGRWIGTVGTIDPLGWDYSSIPEPASGPSTYRYWEPTHQYSGYATGRFSIAESVKLILGGRLDWWKSNSSYTTFNPDNTYEVKGEFTPYAGLIVDIDRNHSIYVSATSIFNPQNYIMATGGLLPPVTGDNYEIGVKGEYLDGRLNVAIAAFQTQQTNLPVLLDASACTVSESCYEAAGKIRARGVDIDITGEITPNFSLTAGYAYSNPKYLDDTVDANAGTEFNTQVPRHLLKASAAWDMSQFLPGLRVGGHVRWQSKIYQVGTWPTTYRSQQNTYAVVDLNARVKITDTFDIQAQINNIFDKYYYQSVGGTTGANVFGDPRNFLVTLRGKF